MRTGLLWALLVVPGLAGILFFGYFTLVDYAALRHDFAQFERAATTANLRTLFVLEARQNMHRINVFADGVWALLCWGVFGIGIHGLAMGRALAKIPVTGEPR